MTDTCDMPRCQRPAAAYYTQIKDKLIGKALCDYHRNELLKDTWGREAVGEQARETTSGR